NIKNDYSKDLSLPKRTPFIKGGADTQLALKATQPDLGDVVIVSGTTTPILQIVDNYYTDTKARCWINKHIENDNFLVEPNADVTWVHYQRLKNLFFPDRSYEEMEDEVLALKTPNSIA